MFCGAAAHSVLLCSDLVDWGENYGAEARANLHFYFKYFHVFLLDTGEVF